MRLVLAGAALLTLALGTASFAASSGDPARGFLSAAVGHAFIPLEGNLPEALTAHGAAVVLAPGVAVTNAHNANIVDADRVLGRSAQYDLLFFRIARGTPLAIAKPKEGMRVVAYGEGEQGELRISYGTIVQLNAPVRALCPVCDVQNAFVFAGNAGPGFSGGPVLDAKTGRLVGITFGYLNDANGERQMYAYDMARVSAEFAALAKPSLVAAR